MNKIEKAKSDLNNLVHSELDNSFYEFEEGDTVVKSDCCLIEYGIKAPDTPTSWFVVEFKVEVEDIDFEEILTSTIYVKLPDEYGYEKWERIKEGEASIKYLWIALLYKRF
ncbi:MAG: hypothetical protein HWN81_12065 [Candidatus Lokiarchaeota archaeon]|nr:hypothetical protein [Candidatus Lokiarchaeota archaeon]